MANRRKIRREIREAKERLGSWQSVNNELFDGKMNTVTLRLIGTTDYFPAVNGNPGIARIGNEPIRVTSIPGLLQRNVSPDR